MRQAPDQPGSDHRVLDDTRQRTSLFTGQLGAEDRWGSGHMPYAVHQDIGIGEPRPRAVEAEIGVAIRLSPRAFEPDRV